MRPVRRPFLLAALPAGVVLALVISSGPVSAAPATVGLGTSTSYAVLAGQAVTNTGPSVISGDLGVTPGNAVTGFPPATVINGAIHAADAVALQAQANLTTAYNDAAGRPFTSDQTGQNLGTQTLVSGVYRDTGGMGLVGTVTLDAQGDPDAVFVFQAASTLITASNSTVALVNGAQPCNVFWQVGSSATLGTGSTFVGTVMALTSISVQTGATVQGRVLARNGQVSLDNNVITRPSCATTPTSPPTTAGPGLPTATATTAAVPASTKASSKPSGTRKPNATRSPSNSSNPTSEQSSTTAPSPTTATTTATTGVPVPTGHPETGRPVPGDGGGAWLLGAGACALGAVVAAAASAGPRRRRSARSA